jgi:hypothetical protein
MKIFFDEGFFVQFSSYLLPIVTVEVASGGCELHFVCVWEVCEVHPTTRGLEAMFQVP